MTWLDSQLLAILLTLPLVSLLYMGLIPKIDIRSIRQLCSAILILWFGLLLRAAYLAAVAGPLSLQVPLAIFTPHSDPLTFSLNITRCLLASSAWFAVFGLVMLDPKRILYLGREFILSILFAFTCSLYAICVNQPIAAFVAALFSMWAYCYIIALHGEGRTGTSILKLGVSFLTLDTMAICVYFMYQTSGAQWLIICIFFSGLSRLLLPVFFPLQGALLAAAPFEGAVISLGVIVPTGAALLHHAHGFLATLATPYIFNLAYAAAALGLLLAGFAALHERAPNFFSVHLLAPYSALYFLAYLQAPFGMIETHAFAEVRLLVCALLCLQALLFVARQTPSHQRFASGRNFRRVWYAALALNAFIPNLGAGALLWSVIAARTQAISDASLHLSLELTYFLAFCFAACLLCHMIALARNLHPVGHAIVHTHKSYVALWCVLLAVAASTWGIALWQP